MEHIDLLMDVFRATSTYEQSRGKLCLWNLVVFCVTGNKFIEKDVQAMRFIAYKIQVFRCDAGVILFTSDEAHVRGNICIPRNTASERLLITRFLHVVDCDAIVDLAIITEQVSVSNRPPYNVVPWCFLTMRKDVDALTLSADDEVVVSGCRRVSCCIVTDVRFAIEQGAVPARVAIGKCGCLCWHGFDGTIVVFRNEEIPTKDASIDTTELYTTSWSRLSRDTMNVLGGAKILRCLSASTMYPSELTGALDECCSAPLHVREYMVYLSVCICGMTDAIMRSSRHLKNATIRSEMLQNMRQVCVLSCAATRSLHRCADLVHFVVALCNGAEGHKWKKWMVNSDIVRDAIQRMDRCAFEKLVDTFNSDTLEILEKTILSIHEWSGNSWYHARYLSLKNSSNDIAEHMNHIERMRGDNERQIIQIICNDRNIVHDDAATTTANSSADTTQPLVEDSDADNLTSKCADESHTALVSAFEREIKHSCALVGSGVFFSDDNDVDVVVLCNSDACTCADDARRVVRRAIDSSPFCSVVMENERIIQVHFRGRQFDVQTVRKDAPDHTVMEVQALQAVRVTSYLTRCTCLSTYTNVRQLHEWATIAGVKNNKLLMLSGIACTCIAISFGSTCGSIRNVLERLYTVLCTDVPHVALGCKDFDSTHDTAAARCCNGNVYPLTVQVQDVCCTKRMTGKTTRYLALACKHALDCKCDHDIMSSTYYSNRVHGEMVFCGSYCPSDDVDTESRVARDMPRIVRQLDTCELIESIKLEQSNETDGRHCGFCISVYVHMRHGVDVSRYGFAALGPYTVENIDDNYAYVLSSSTKRTYIVPRVPGNESNDMTRRTHVHLKSHEKSMVVPDSPYLYSYVASSFQTHAWCAVDSAGHK